jgi:hypothetical protein
VGGGESRVALAAAREALERARHVLRAEGETWAQRDIEEALRLVRTAIDDLGRPSDRRRSGE